MTEAKRQISAAEFAGSDSVSPTAASVGNKLYGTSGVIPYRVQMQTAIGAQTFVDVDAATGDEAAELALKQMSGGKVMHVEPAPQKKAA